MSINTPALLPYWLAPAPYLNTLISLAQRADERVKIRIYSSRKSGNIISTYRIPMPGSDASNPLKTTAIIGGNALVKAKPAR